MAAEPIQGGDFVNQGKDKFNAAIGEIPTTYNLNTTTGVLTITKASGEVNTVNFGSAFATLAQIVDAIFPGMATLEEAGLVFMADEDDPSHESAENRVYSAAGSNRRFGGLDKVLKLGNDSQRALAAGLLYRYQYTNEEGTHVPSWIKKNDLWAEARPILLSDLPGGGQDGTVNIPPELIIPIPNKTGVVGVSLIIAVPRTTFNDRDNDTITLTGIGAPAGMVWNSVDWQFEGTPTEIGSFTLTLIADDGHGGITTSTFNLTVTDPDVENTPPIVGVLSPVTGKVGQALTFIIQLNWFSDPDGVDIYFDVPNAQMVPGMNTRILEDGKTRGFQGIPTTAGTYQIPVRASDYGSPSLSTTANLTVVITTDAGVLTLQAPTWNGADGTLHLNVSGGNGSVIDYEILTPNIRGWGQSPDFVVPTQWRNGVALTLEARQSGQVVTRQFTTFSDSGNLPPAIQNPPQTQSTTAGTFFSLTLPENTAVDPEGQPVGYEALDLPSWLSFNPATRAFGGTSPITAANTSVSVQIRCSDPLGAFTPTTLNITINQPTGPVAGVIATNVVYHYDAENDTIDIRAGDLINASGGQVYVSIERGDAVAMNGNSYGTQPWVSGERYPMSPYSSGGLTLTKAFYNQGGVGTGIPEQPLIVKLYQGAVVQTLTGTPSDGDHTLSTSSNTNRAPVRNIATLFFNGTAGQAIDAPAAIFSSNKFTDPDGDTLTWSMVALTGGTWDSNLQNPTATEVALPGWATFNSSNLQLSGILPASLVTLNYGFRVKVTDPGGLTAHDDFRINATAPTAPPDNEGDPISYFSGEMTGLRVTPRPPSATGEDAKNMNWGFEAYQLLDRPEGTSERNQKPYYLLARSRVGGRCQIGHFLVLRWNEYERTLNTFNDLIDDQYDLALENFRLAGEKVYLGIGSARGDGSGRFDFISDAEAQKWPDGSTTYAKTFAVQARYDLDYELLRSGTTWWTSASHFPGKLYRYVKHFCEARKAYWLNGVIQGVSGITSTTDETAYTRDFFDGVLRWTDFSSEMKASWRTYYGLDSGTTYPYNSSDPIKTFNSEIGRLVQYHRTHLLAARFATICFAIYDVMPGVPLIPDYGGWYHNEAPAVGSGDPHLFFEILINEYLRPRYPTTTIRFVMKHNPFPTDNNKAGGLLTGGVQFWISDTNTHFQFVIQDQDYISASSDGKIKGLNAAELAAKNIDYMQKSGGHCASFLHGTVGGIQFDTAMAALDAYCSTPNRVSNAIPNTSDYGIVYHSPEDLYSDPSAYRSKFESAVNTASNGYTRKVMVKRAPRIEFIDLGTFSGQKKARITMSYPVAGVGKVQINISGSWQDVTEFESEFVAIAYIPSSFTTVILRPANNPTGVVTRPLTGLTGSYVEKHFAFRSQLE